MSTKQYNESQRHIGVSFANILCRIIMNSTRVVFLFSIISVIGCSEEAKKDTKIVSISQIVPESLNFKKPQKLGELSEDKLKEIANIMRVESKLQLPESDLILPNFGSDVNSITESEYNNRLLELRKTNLNSYEYLTLINSKCRKYELRNTLETTINEKLNLDEIDYRVGDKFRAQYGAGLLGADCPIAANFGSGYGARIDEKNQVKNLLAGELGINSKLFFKITDDKLSKLVGTRGLTFESKSSGIAIRRVLEIGKTDKILLKFNLSGKYNSIITDVPFKSEVTVLLDKRKDQVTNSNIINSEIINNVELRFDHFSALITFYDVVIGSTLVKHDIYINGHLKSKEEIKKYFGNSLELISVDVHNKIKINL